MHTQAVLRDPQWAILPFHTLCLTKNKQCKLNIYTLIYNLFEKGFPPFNDLSKEFKFETEIFEFEYFGKTSSRNGNLFSTIFFEQ